MDKVITSLNLRAREGMTDITATSLANMVSISQVNSTQVMRIAATTADQTLSTEIVTEIVHIAPELIIQTVKAGSVEVITPPRARDGKVSPSTSKNAILGGLLGLLISTLVDTQMAAILASGMGLMMPTMILSGLVFPIESMPAVLQWISAIVPARWYIEAIRKIMIQGVGIEFVMREFGILAVMTCFLLVLSLKKFKTRLS